MSSAKRGWVHSARIKPGSRRGPDEDRCSDGCSKKTGDPRFQRSLPAAVYPFFMAAMVFCLRRMGDLLGIARHNGINAEKAHSPYAAASRKRFKALRRPVRRYSAAVRCRRDRDQDQHRRRACGLAPTRIGYHADKNTHCIMTQIQRNDKVKSAASSARTLLQLFNKQNASPPSNYAEAAMHFMKRKGLSAFLQKFSAGRALF